MDMILESVEIYDRLMQNKYRIDIENGDSLFLVFRSSNYHHLAGFQHLTDQPYISKLEPGRFYRALKSKQIPEHDLVKSTYFETVRSRLQEFSRLEKILTPGDKKLIIDFDATKTGTKIRADYSLFERTPAPSSAYHHLFIGYNGKLAYPVTYVVEHGKTYISEQNILDCSISLV